MSHRVSTSKSAKAQAAVAAPLGRRGRSLGTGTGAARNLTASTPSNTRKSSSGRHHR